MLGLSPALRRSTIMLSRRWNSALVICDPLMSNGAPPSSTQSVVKAASHLWVDHVNLLVVGGEHAPVQSLVGVTKVIHIPRKELTVDSIKDAIEDAIVKENCTHVLGNSTTSSSSMLVLPEIAKQFGTPMAEDVVGVINRDTFLTGDDKKTIQLKDSLKILGIRPSSFEPVDIVEGPSLVEIWKEPSRLSKLAYRAAPPTFLLLVAILFIPMDS